MSCRTIDLKALTEQKLCVYRHISVGGFDFNQAALTPGVYYTMSNEHFQNAVGLPPGVCAGTVFTGIGPYNRNSQILIDWQKPSMLFFRAPTVNNQGPWYYVEAKKVE